ncbi:hypothetical protein PCASD_25102, partial [Puccinia coronata f. sp. avenae]
PSPHNQIALRGREMAVAPLCQRKGEQQLPLDEDCLESSILTQDTLTTLFGTQHNHGATSHASAVPTSRSSHRATTLHASAATVSPRSSGASELSAATATPATAPPPPPLPPHTHEAQAQAANQLMAPPPVPGQMPQNTGLQPGTTKWRRNEPTPLFSTRGKRPTTARTSTTTRRNIHPMCPTRTRRSTQMAPVPPPVPEEQSPCRPHDANAPGGQFFHESGENDQPRPTSPTGAGWLHQPISLQTTLSKIR